MLIRIKKILKNDVIINSTWLITDKVIRLIGGLLIGAYIARYLGPEKYGLMNFAISFSILFTSFSMLGIDNLVVRDLSKNTNNINDILGTALRIRILGSVFSAILALVFSYIFYYTDNVMFFKLLTILMLCNVFQSFDVISLLYQSRLESKIIVINKLIAYIFISLSKIIAVVYGANVIGFIFLNSLEVLLAMCLLIRWAVVNDNLNINLWKYVPEFSKNLLYEGWPIAIGNLSIIIFMKVDQIFLGLFLGNKEVGIYSIASLISDILYSIPVFISASILPKITKLYGTDIQKYKNYVSTVFCSIVLYSYISIIGVYFFVDDFIRIFYGVSYSISADIAKVHSLTLLFVSIGCVRGSMLLVEKKTKLLSIITVIGGLINITLNYIFINKFGMYGAAVSALISQIIVCYLSGIFHKSLFEIFYMQTKAIILQPLINKFKI